MKRRRSKGKEHRNGKGREKREEWREEESQKTLEKGKAESVRE